MSMTGLATPGSTGPKTYQQVMDGKAKPPGSLGHLEDWAIKLADLQQTPQPRVAGAFLLLFAADHGFTAARPGVSAYPRQVTPAMFHAIARGQAASSVLCAANDCELLLVDVGVDADLQQPQQTGAAAVVDRRHVHHRKVCRGSANFLDGPAMIQEQCSAALKTGADAVAYACQHFRSCLHAGQGAPSQNAVCVGELGIGNTTAAAALLAALTGAAPESVCGRGTGVDDAGLALKVATVASALEVNAAQIQEGPLAALAAVGGLEIAAMAGAYLEAGRQGVPAIVDGFISGVAALAAVKAEPGVARCLFVSHMSREHGAQLVVKELGMEPLMDMKLRLGEGTGAVLGLPLLRSAAAIMSKMASLADVMVADKGAGCK